MTPRCRAEGLLKSAERYNRSNPASQQWLQGATMRLTFRNSTYFTDWFEDGGVGFAFGGMQLADWPEWAANNNRLPAQVCGAALSGAAARHLHDQVFAHDPGMLKNDPWGS